MMNRKIFFLLFTLTACTPTNEPVKTDVHQPDVRSEHSPDSAVKISAIEVVIHLAELPKADFRQKCDSFISAYRVNYTTQPSEKNSMLTRFENGWMKHVALEKKFQINYGEKEVYPVAYLGFYEYTDSAQCANAYSNWLACFGNDCNQVTPGEAVQIKSTPGYYIINRNEIITLDYPLEHEKNNWEEMKQNLRRLFARSNSVIIEVSPHGRLQWK